MEVGNVGTEQARNALARGENASDDLGAADPLEYEHRIASLRRERPQDRGDFLVGGHLVIQDQNVVGVLGAVALEEAMEVLLYFGTPA
jgi:hypothetical protein